MKTLKEYKELLYSDEQNTLLGLHLNYLFNESNRDYNASVHHLEEKIEVIVQMYNNGINCFTDNFQLGSVTKAFYQVKLNDYTDF